MAAAAAVGGGSAAAASVTRSRSCTRLVGEVTRGLQTTEGHNGPHLHSTLFFFFKCAAGISASSNADASSSFFWKRSYYFRRWSSAPFTFCLSSCRCGRNAVPDADRQATSQLCLTGPSELRNQLEARTCDGCSHNMRSIARLISLFGRDVRCIPWQPLRQPTPNVSQRSVAPRCMLSP